MSGNEFLVLLAIVAVIVILFVCCFISSPRMRFVLGAGLIVAVMGVFVMGARHANEEAVSLSSPPLSLAPSRTSSPMAPAPQATEPVLLIPLATPRRTPSPAEVAAEIARKYGGR